MDRINGADTFDIGGGRRGFRSESLTSGVAGTEVTALFLNSVQEEIMKVIVGAGLVPDAADWSQLWQALKVLGLSRGNRNNRWTAVKAINVTAPPAAPADGDIYLVPAAATGAWAGHAGAIAEWVDAAWSYYVAPNGHGIGLPDGRLFMKIAGDYVEWLEGLPLSLSKLSRMPWISVISMTLSSAPGAPTRGDCYLVPTGASGIWATSVGKIAEWTGTAWAYSTPADGHGLSLPDGRIFERVAGSYKEKIASDVQSGKWTYAAATGTANALAVGFTPPIAALSAGLRTEVMIGITNTGAATINVDGLGAKSIISPTGGALLAGDLKAGNIATLIYDGAAFQLAGTSSGAVANAYITAGRPPQTAPFFLANGVGGGASYPHNVITVSTDLALVSSQFLDPATTFVGGTLTVGEKDAGVWQFGLNLGINANQASWTSKVQIVKNADVTVGYVEGNVYGTPGTGNFSTTGTVRLAAGDTVRPCLLQNSGASQASSPFGRFSGSRIGV